MFQNLLVSPITPLRKIDEINNWENKPFTTVWPDPRPIHKQRKEPEIKRKIQKKSKRFRTAFTTEQVRALEKTFSNSKYIDPENRKKLAESLRISDKAIKVWFQNRRMKEKRDESWESSTESFDSSPLSNLETSIAFKPDKLEVDNDIPFLPETRYLESSNECDPQRSTSEHYWFLLQSGKNHESVNHSSYYQAPDNYKLQYQDNMMPYQVVPDSFAYDNNVYPTEYYPNGQFGNERDYLGGNFTQQPDYANGYGWAAYNYYY